MATTEKVWTLEELHSLPDDGNKYELIHGVLFVTPPPNPEHEDIAARLTRLLDPYVAAQGLGYVYHPRSVIRRDQSEVEPDLIVRRPSAKGVAWEAKPVPALVVEILSSSTRRRDRAQKRAFYLEIGVPDYWIVDPDDQAITVARPGESDIVERDTVQWRPADADEPFELVVAKVFTAG